MTNEDFKEEVLMLLNKISAQLENKEFYTLPSTKTKSRKPMSKMSQKELRAHSINALVKTLGPKFLNYIKE